MNDLEDLKIRVSKLEKFRADLLEAIHARCYASYQACENSLKSREVLDKLMKRDRYEA